MDLGLAGKIALITGASKGIRRAAAESLAAEGCSVIIVSRSTADLAAPGEVGSMIAFPALERCSYNGGAVVTINAGLSARTLNF